MNQDVCLKSAIDDYYTAEHFAHLEVLTLVDEEMICLLAMRFPVEGQYYSVFVMWKALEQSEMGAFGWLHREGWSVRWYGYEALADSDCRRWMGPYL
ncbi:hypothetical protein SERLADRAFT_458864 [Serpula lacrymans var. lacrymans S7.9]|uniref:Uncharacterized protein n=1 Tax=Serpula lacrymans var. lacrymans (strain S7.9) TaxID=578457 RepID=F8NKN9_SERL9|nr:uncharacterized protein SERLADRAFT_458864 [Serpula lacrymans var. lacrymans S7.9]EGO28451.1 hypothetical protein SERLADRAFT_458864 [Serpula lacrymans var. lacrymans S7.9]